MKTFVNNFFWKKSDFQYDIELRALNELWYHVFTKERKLIKLAIPRNIIYFAKHKKLFILKLLSYATAILLAVGVTISIILFALNYFGVIDINITKPKPKIEKVLTVYLPDTDTIAQVECIKRHIKYNLIFLPDSRKNWNLYKRRFQQIEAHGLSDAGAYFARNGEYWGKYQMGEMARALVGLKNVTWKEFSSNPEMQEGAFLAWIRILKGLMQPEINRYVGTYMNGIEITESGIIALAHNIGDGACRSFLKNNGSTFAPNSIPMKFLRIGGYSINIE